MYPTSLSLNTVNGTLRVERDKLFQCTTKKSENYSVFVKFDLFTK